MKNRTPLTDEQQAMVEANLRLAYREVSRWFKDRRFSRSFDDARSEAVLGLIQAVRCFDASRGIAFSSYAIPAIQRSIRRFMARESRVDEKNKLLGEQSSENSTLRYRWRVIKTFPFQIGLSSKVWQTLYDLPALIDTTLKQHLTPREYELFKARYLEDKTFKEIAQPLGVSKQAIQDRDRQLRPKLHRILRDALDLKGLWQIYRGEFSSHEQH